MKKLIELTRTEPSYWSNTPTIFINPDQITRIYIDFRKHTIVHLNNDIKLDVVETPKEIEALCQNA